MPIMCFHLGHPSRPCASLHYCRPFFLDELVGKKVLAGGSFKKTLDYIICPGTGGKTHNSWRPGPPRPLEDSPTQRSALSTGRFRLFTDRWTPHPTESSKVMLGPRKRSLLAIGKETESSSCANLAIISQFKTHHFHSEEAAFHWHDEDAARHRGGVSPRSSAS